MCRSMEELRDDAFKEGWKEGWAEGSEERAMMIARDMLQSGEMSPEQVAKFTRLPLEKVQALC